MALWHGTGDMADARLVEVPNELSQLALRMLKGLGRREAARLLGCNDRTLLSLIGGWAMPGTVALAEKHAALVPKPTMKQLKTWDEVLG